MSLSSLNPIRTRSVPVVWAECEEVQSCRYTGGRQRSSGNSSSKESRVDLKTTWWYGTPISLALFLSTAVWIAGGVGQICVPTLRPSVRAVKCCSSLFSEDTFLHVGVCLFSYLFYPQILVSVRQILVFFWVPLLSVMVFCSRFPVVLVTSKRHALLTMRLDESHGFSDNWLMILNKFCYVTVFSPPQWARFPPR